MSHLEELVESLLYEGYALYPYTPGATKNATPTPFGIVYPPAYAESLPTAHDHVRLECGLQAGDGTPVSATIRFLQAGGPDQRGVERRIELPAPGEATEFSFDGLDGRARLRVDAAREGVLRVRVCLHNTTAFDQPDAGRGKALRSSMLSTHVVVRSPGNRFLSPMEHADEFESVNTFPVLATRDDDTVLGASIMLPDHPQVAPQSRGNLFDSTEIEEALLLHVHTLSDGEREAIADQDPAVAAMVQRAAATTPADLFDLHGVMSPSDALGGEPGSVQSEPPREPANLPELTGEAEVTDSAGVTFRRGDRVRLMPGIHRDPYDRMMHGRFATIEKILHDVDDKLYFAVAIEGEGQDLLRETGRHTFFFEGEVEPA